MNMPVLSRHAKGLIITALGVLIISPDGLLTRLIGVDHWTLLFWRTLFLCFGMFLIVSVTCRGRAWRQYQSMRREDALMVLVYSFGTISFIVGLTHTSVANTLLILSTTPLFAAIIGRVFLATPIPVYSWCAIASVAAGIFIISSDSENQVTSLFGDMAALAGALMLATGFTLVRRYPTISIFPVISTSGLFTALLVLPLAQPFSVTGADMSFLLIMGLLTLPAGTALMYLGPRYIPAPEVGLMLLLESILGPIWVWLALGEQPGTRSFIGGAIILSTLAINTLWVLKSPPGGACR